MSDDDCEELIIDSDVRGEEEEEKSVWRQRKIHF